MDEGAVAEEPGDESAVDFHDAVDDARLAACEEGHGKEGESEDGGRESPDVLGELWEGSDMGNRERRKHTSEPGIAGVRQSNSWHLFLPWQPDTNCDYSK